AVFKKCCKFAIYGILEQDQNIQIFETINPSILFMCPSSILKFKTKNRITFFLYNLLTRTKEPGSACLRQVGFAPIFLRRTHVS
ncbi:hypothetical protein, partial [Leptospira noguchii]|uniref:hypothetical protein n=1 Tax=Leptospira noguchii TaxID=28182 RepID=UPI001C665EE9